MAINRLQLPSSQAFTPDITPTLANLVNTINKGQQRQTLADLGRGLADGTIDYKQAAGKLASTGDLASTLSLLKLGQEQEASKAFGSSLSNLYPGSATSAPPMGNAGPAASGPTVPNDSNAIPGTVGMNQRLADLSQDFIQDNPGTSMTSGLRSREDQARLYADRGNNPNPVAPPGSSRHERGLAVDIGGMTPEQRALLPQYGLAQPVANDPPHVELAGNAQAAQAGPQPQAGGISPRAVQLIKMMSVPGISEAQKEAGGKLLAAELDQSKLPDAVKQYVFAKSQDPNIGSYTDWTRANKAAGATAVNVDTRSQNAFAKAGGEAIAKRFEKLSEEGDTATQDLALVGQLRDLGTKIKTGGGAAIRGTLAQYGIKLGDNIGEIEAYGSIVDKLTPQQRVPGSGSSSDVDVKMFKSALPNLVKTPAGNEIVQNTLAGLAQSKIDRAKIAEAALAGEIEPKEALKQLRALPSPYDNFKKFAKGGFKADPNAPVRDPQQRTQMAPQDVDASLANARDAISRGAPRDAVIKMLRENGIDASGL